MPYRLARRSFVVRLLRFPDRFSLFAALPMAVLAAYGTRHILGIGLCRGKWRNIAVFSLLTLIITFEYLVVPVPLKQPHFSPIFAALAREPETFGVLNLPIDAQVSKRYMLDQTIHQRAILQGHVSRIPEGAYAYLDSHPMLKTLRQFGEMDPALTDVSRQLAFLAEDDVRYLVMHKEEVEPSRLARWRRYLLTRPRFEDEQAAVFSTSPLARRDFTLTEELSTGIGPIQMVSRSECLSPGQVMEVSVGWGATIPPNRALDVELSLVSSDDTVAQAAVYALHPSWPTDEWPANTLAWGYYPLRLEASLPPATYQIRLALVDPETKERQGHSTVAGELTVSEPPCAVTAPPNAVCLNAVFGDALRLLGYRIRSKGNRLLVTLHWRSEQRMAIDYKVFVHVFNPETNIPVAQDDAMPQRWRYPTTLWGPGEQIEDEIPIDIRGVAPGRYGVAVGVYDPQTMERLPVVDGEGQACPDGRLILPEELVNTGHEDQ
jgi:hypothetical protein